jgi:predicted nucleotidyltransferase
MVLKREQFKLEQIATKNTIKVLRFLTTKPYLTFGLTELSEELRISKSNVLRILEVLCGCNLIIAQKSGKKKVFRINSEKDIIKLLWNLFMSEMRYNLPTSFKNVIDLFYEQVKNDVELFILFGSVAQGLATEESDIDICVVSEKAISARRFDFLPHRFEIHTYLWDDVKDPNDFVILDALLKGVVYKGDVFNILADLKSFPKSYLIYRIEKAKKFLKKAELQENEANEYYKNIAKITVGEVESLLHRKSTIPKRAIAFEDINIEAKIKILEEELVREGERIWLI